VFQPLRDGLDLPVDEAAVTAYDAAYALLEQQHPEALAAFEALASRYPDDGLVAVHLERLRRGETGDVIVLDRK
jgi:adenylate cyclase